MSRDAVQQYGVQTMSKLNRGRMPAKFAEGGLVGDSGANNGLSGDSSAGLTNNVNITVNIDNNGSLSANVDSSAQSENVAGSQRQQSRELAKTIESAVIKVITDQKKQGGLLR
jgi:outer membrane protein TolC